MPRTVRQQLAAAHQECRDLKNELHEVGKQHLPLRNEIAELRGKLAAAEAALALVPKYLSFERERLSDAELYALAALVATEALPATPARARLLQEITARGAIMTVEQASLLASVKRPGG